MNAPLLYRPHSVARIMLSVLAALVPLIVVQVWFFGMGILIQLTLASLTALVCEAAILRLRQRALTPLQDYSALLTAWLIALSMPPLGAWWLIVLATALAIILGKQLYGGLGHNPFNPAMLGFAAMMVAFPAHMTQWGQTSAPMDAASQWQWIFQPASRIDALASATPLDYLKTQLLLGKQSVEQLLNSTNYHPLGGIASLWQAAALLLPALLLMQQRLMAWQTPLAMLLGLAAVATPLWLWQPEHYANPLFHILTGASLLTALFIVTDPVTSPSTVLGRVIFGLAVGGLIYVIRVFGGFPDGAAFAVLIMNMAVPLIDRHTQPRVFGQPSGPVR